MRTNKEICEVDIDSECFIYRLQGPEISPAIVPKVSPENTATSAPSLAPILHARTTDCAASTQPKVTPVYASQALKANTASWTATTVTHRLAGMAGHVTTFSTASPAHVQPASAEPPASTRHPALPQTTVRSVHA